MDESEKVKEFISRIQYLIENVFGTKLSLAKAIGVNEVTVKRWLSGENKPFQSCSVVLMENLKLYNINPTWFIDGIGETFIDPLKKNVFFDTQDEIAERLNLVRRHLRINTWNAMSEEFGISNSTLHMYKNGRVKMSDEFINKLSDKGINREWLETGKGHMIDGEDNDLSHADNSITVKSSKLIPYFPADVTASIVQSFDDLLMTPSYYVQCSFLNDCDACFPVFGDSMYPKFCSGDIIGVRKHDSGFILWGETYLVVTNSDGGNLRTLKVIYQHTDPKNAILRASNPNFAGDTIIPIDSIVSLHIVRGKLHINSF